MDINDDPKKAREEYALSLQAELAKKEAALLESQSYIKALTEEFSKASSEDEVTTTALTAIKDMLPEAIQHFRAIMCTSDNDATRASLAKFVIGIALDRNKVGDGKDNEVTELLKRLTNNKPAKAAKPKKAANPVAPADEDNG